MARTRNFDKYKAFRIISIENISYNFARYKQILYTKIVFEVVFANGVELISFQNHF